MKVNFSSTGHNANTRRVTGLLLALGGAVLFFSKAIVAKLTCRHEPVTAWQIAGTTLCLAGILC